MVLLTSYECLAQLGEHFLDVEGVMGSSPLALTIIFLENRSVMRFFHFVGRKVGRACHFCAAQSEQFIGRNAL